MSINAARTNYVFIEDIDGLRRSLEEFRCLSIEEHDELPGFFSLHCGTLNGTKWGWPCRTDRFNADGTCEPGLSFEINVMPFVREGEVLVAQEAHTQHDLGVSRYVTARSEAFVRQGSNVKKLCLDLADIHAMAAKAFGKPCSQQSHADTHNGMPDDVTYAMYGHMEKLCELLESGDLNLADRAPVLIHAAASKGRITVLDFLEDKGFTADSNSIRKSAGGNEKTLAWLASREMTARIDDPQEERKEPVLRRPAM